MSARAALSDRSADDDAAHRSRRSIMRMFVNTPAAALRRSPAAAAVLASGLAALAIGLAAPATAAPSGLADGNGHHTTQPEVTANADGWLDDAGMTPYGTYQNDDPRKSASHR